VRSRVRASAFAKARLTSFGEQVIHISNVELSASLVVPLHRDIESLTFALLEGRLQKNPGVSVVDFLRLEKYNVPNPLNVKSI